MTRLIPYIAQAAAAIGPVMAPLQSLLLRVSIIGLTGILLEIGGRIALSALNTALHSAPIHRQSRHLS